MDNTYLTNMTQLHLPLIEPNATFNYYCHSSYMRTDQPTRCLLIGLAIGKNITQALSSKTPDLYRLQRLQKTNLSILDNMENQLICPTI